MQTKTVRNTLNYNYLDIKNEVNNMPSETVPDETMSIREILDRYARGLPVGGSRVAFYEDDGSEEYFPDPRTLDLSERAEYKQQAIEELSQIQKNKRKKAPAGAPAEPSSTEGAGNDNLENIPPEEK